MEALIKRINELYKKSKAEGLTTEELAEQAEIRRKYIDKVKGNLVQTLDNTVFIDENGEEIDIHKKHKKQKH